MPLGRFYRAVREPFLIAFSTASSEAALPLALENMERFGVPKHIVAFVMPTGYSFNLDGTTLYLSLASVFVAQAAGVELSFGQQIADDADPDAHQQGRGRRAARRAGDPGGHAGAPSTCRMEGVAVLLGVDAVMDMARTSVNVLGNCLATAVVARWEGTTFPTELNPALKGN